MIKTERVWLISYDLKITGGRIFPAAGYFCKCIFLWNDGKNNSGNINRKCQNLGKYIVILFYIDFT